MSQLALASANAHSARWAHDIRNVLTTVGLHLETLERLSGTRGREVASAAHTLMSRVATMCSEAIAQDIDAEVPSRRKPLDLSLTMMQIANLMRPTAPEGFEIRVVSHGAVTVSVDAQEVFRILFNLVHNAISFARKQTGGSPRMTHVELLAERRGATVTIRISDDGPGLPSQVRARLFRRQRSNSGGSGLGLSIARELAERNGGVLRYEDAPRGATFVLELNHAPGVATDAGALRSLGKSARH